MPKLAKSIVTLLIVVAFWASATEARAGSTGDCIPWDVEFYTGNDAAHPEPVMVLHCLNDPISYRAYYDTNPESCATLTSQQVTTWLGMLTSAYLYGLAVSLNWSVQTCGQTTIDALMM